MNPICVVFERIKISIINAITLSDESSDSERRTEQKRWQKQPTVVAKRNARERTRVHTVNQAFVTLKFHLPSLRAHTKRVSKLKILNAAICYIDSLVAILKGAGSISLFFDSHTGVM
nr:Basic helix-loop-helix dimerisation region bHLH domain containing protein [Haemonchus contortus]